MTITLDMDVGFYFFNEWRYGPLYAFISIASQAFLTRDPFTIEKIGEDGGDILLLFDGENLTGEEDVANYLVNVLDVLSGDFVEFLSFKELLAEQSQEEDMGSEAVENAELDTDNPIPQEDNLAESTKPTKQDEESKS